MTVRIKMYLKVIEEKIGIRSENQLLLHVSDGDDCNLCDDKRLRFINMMIIDI